MKRTHCLAWMLAWLALVPIVYAGEHSPLAGTMTTVDGQAINLAAQQPVDATVIVFLSTECPIASGYFPTLNRLATSWRADERVKMLGVVSDPTLSRAAAAKYAKDFDLTFPLVFDGSGLIAKRFAPSHVPEAFVLDA